MFFKIYFMRRRGGRVCVANGVPYYPALEYPIRYSYRMPLLKENLSFPYPPTQKIIY